MSGARRTPVTRRKAASPGAPAEADPALLTAVVAATCRAAEPVPNRSAGSHSPWVRSLLGGAGRTPDAFRAPFLASSAKSPPVFEALTKGFREAQNRLAGLTELNEKNVQAALKEVRLSLLEADVELGVVKRFLATVEEKALGQTVQTRVRHGGETHRVTAGDQFVRICHDELVAMMDYEGDPITFAASGPTGVMMVGLQGSGKTTTTAKLARWFEKQGKSPLLVAADMQRPAAVE